MENPSVADFRIDFVAATAFIGLPQFPIMSSDRSESPVPLAEIAQGPSAFEQFLDKNQKLLVIVAILLVLASAALVVFRGVKKSHEQTAGTAFFKASDLPALRKVIDEFAGTRAANSATIQLADQQWTSGQQDDAIATLRGFIASNPDHPAIATARASLGSKLMAQGKPADAAAAFQEIVDDTRSRYLAPFALVSLGDLAKASGDTDKAETFYSRARADFPDSGFASTAAERIASLRASMPVEVEPPPAPPEPAPETPATNGVTAPQLVPSITPASQPNTSPDTLPPQDVQLPESNDTAPNQQPDAPSQP